MASTSSHQTDICDLPHVFFHHLLAQYLNETNVSNFASVSKSMSKTLKNLDKQTIYVFMKDYLKEYLSNTCNLKRAKVVWCNGRSRGSQKFTIDLNTFFGGPDLMNTVKEFCEISGLQAPTSNIQQLFNRELKLKFSIKYNISRKRGSDNYFAKIRNMDILLYDLDEDNDENEIAQIYVNSPDYGTSAFMPDILISIKKWVAFFLQKISSLVLNALCSIQNLGELELIIANGKSNVKIKMDNVRHTINEIRTALEEYDESSEEEESNEEEVVELNERANHVRFFTENYVSSQGLLTHSQVDALIRERQIAVAFFVQNVHCVRTYDRTFPEDITLKVIEFTLQNGVKIYISYGTTEEDPKKIDVVEYLYVDTDVSVLLNIIGIAPYRCEGFVSRQDLNNICSTMQLIFTGLAVFKRRLSCKRINNQTNKIRIISSIPIISDDVVKNVIGNIDDFNKEFIRDMERKIRCVVQRQERTGGNRVLRDKKVKKKLS
jgi:hypothetical protein